MMDLSNKLKGIPNIYYFNLDNRKDRRDYIESQFKDWGVENYTRVSGTKYLGSQWNTWKHLVEGEYSDENNSPPVTANAITHIEFLSWWLENTNDELLVLMEDDCSLHIVQYWHFDWEYLMNNLPYDWDCIQLLYATKKKMKFFLSPKPTHGTYFGTCLLSRRHIEKIVSLHYKNNKFILNHRINDWEYADSFLTLDYIICSTGRTYCIPIMSANTKFGSFEDNTPNLIDYHVRCAKLEDYWWQNKRDDFTLNDFFTYGKPYDHLMTLTVY